MCLDFSRTLSNEWLKKQRKTGKTSVVFWKVVTNDRRPPLRQNSSVIYSVGSIIDSGRKTKRAYKIASTDNSYRVERGIHAFVSREAARNSWIKRNFNQRKIIKVECNLDDLIGIDTYYGAAAFIKVKVLT